jgi:hypothetical protein
MDGHTIFFHSLPLSPLSALFFSEVGKHGSRNGDNVISSFWLQDSGEAWGEGRGG